MGSGTSQYGEKNVAKMKPIDVAEMTYFNQQIDRMKYGSKQKVFKQKSLETKDAIADALVNLRKNKLLNTGQFKELNKGSRPPIRNRLKTDKTQLIKKMYLVQNEPNYTHDPKSRSRKRNKSEDKLPNYRYQYGIPNHQSVNFIAD